MYDVHVIVHVCRVAQTHVMQLTCTLHLHLLECYNVVFIVKHVNIDKVDDVTAGRRGRGDYWMERGKYTCNSHVYVTVEDCLHVLPKTLPAK